MLLGVSGPHVWAAATLDLEPGDTVVLFTDGLIERRHESLVEGLERLAGVVTALTTTDPEQLCEGIVDQLLPAGEDRSDDVAILVARVDAPSFVRLGKG